MKKSIEKEIIKRIHGNGTGWVFSARDFASLGSRSAIDLTLHRLVHEGKIRRAIRGIYYYPKWSTFLNLELSPGVDNISRALARKFGWSTQPAGAIALNLLGLSTQVPAKAVYLSNGPRRTYRFDKTTIIFQHSALKEAIFKLPESRLIVQALKALGPDRITSDVTAKIRAWLDPKLHEKVLHDTRTSTGWIYAAIQKILNGASHA